MGAVPVALGVPPERLERFVEPLRRGFGGQRGSERVDLHGPHNPPIAPVDRDEAAMPLPAPPALVQSEARPKPRRLYRLYAEERPGGGRRGAHRERRRRGLSAPAPFRDGPRLPSIAHTSFYIGEGRNPPRLWHRRPEELLSSGRFRGATPA